jgi:transcriptional regulator with XRE-family HTH domain
MKDIRFLVSSKVREHRLKRDLTQEQLSQESGIDYKYIQRIEGKNPPNIQINTLQRLAEALKVTPETLIK